MSANTSPQTAEDELPPIKPKFLDLVENLYAGESNPHRIGIYIRSGSTPRGQINSGKFYEFTDGKGGYWQMAANGKNRRIVGNLITSHTNKARIKTLQAILDQTPNGKPISKNKIRATIIATEKKK